ncbi:MAG: hypothetical protein E6053_08965 [Finegoldia magna]|uniref:hypothetical protein n=1 Tax=Finegoldia magna TaxID=1260 RepID=UPI0001DE5050|nr:hypothetical protein [Finegoldia magna]EFK94534.1 hypothetical protein HMPREF9261_1227 [Finegoldia magna ACS-171-V-Col3]MDU5273123.1 hypothetical protein [Finegoldia magna]MDU5527582.1 hypothetical protein [Finegoldia magna]MDU6598855.1 hypothetical protein [Finegoldia magna]MDU7141089.1 hypothetical protein [Finegoldia magna]
MKKKFLTVLLVLSMVVLASCSNQKGSELESKLKEVETDKKFALENLKDANNKIKELNAKIQEQEQGYSSKVLVNDLTAQMSNEQLQKVLQNTIAYKLTADDQELEKETTLEVAQMPKTLNFIVQIPEDLKSSEKAKTILNLQAPKINVNGKAAQVEEQEEHDAIKYVVNLESAGKEAKIDLPQDINAKLQRPNQQLVIKAK